MEKDSTEKEQYTGLYTAHFSHLLNGLRSEVPPHGGIALGEILIHIHVSIPRS